MDVIAHLLSQWVFIKPAVLMSLAFRVALVESNEISRVAVGLIETFCHTTYEIVQSPRLPIHFRWLDN